jgi:hypothetical protein
MCARAHRCVYVSTTKCLETRDAGRRAPSSATRENRPDPVPLVGSEPTDDVTCLL